MPNRKDVPHPFADQKKIRNEVCQMRLYNVSRTCIHQLHSATDVYY